MKTLVTVLSALIFATASLVVEAAPRHAKSHQITHGAKATKAHGGKATLAKKTVAGKKTRAGKKLRTHKPR